MAKDSESKKEAVEAEIVPDASEPVSKITPSHQKTNNWNIGRIFWGLLLVVVGGLLLAGNYGWVQVDWARLWQLWPLMIIAAGLSVLSLRNWLWRVLSIVLVVLALALVVLVAVGGYPASRETLTQEATVQQTSADIKQANISIKAGASELRINTAEQDVTAKVKLQSNVASLSEVSRLSGDVQQIDLSMNTNQHWWFGDVRSIWDVWLTKNLPLSLSIDAGASDITLDMTEAQLKDLSVKAGASSIVLSLGERQDTTAVKIDSGASSIVLRVPAASGVQLKLDNGLTSKRLADLVEVGDNMYESPGYAQATKKINITGNVGVASFTIERY